MQWGTSILVLTIQLGMSFTCHVTKNFDFDIYLKQKYKWKEM